MSSHSVSKIDQKEYLKKYLSGDKAKKKKKDKKHKRASKDSVKVRIIDDDVNHLDSGPQIDEELLLTGDDAPQIVGEYIEETPGERKVPKWKSIVIKDEPDENEGRPASNNGEDLWGRTSKVKIKSEFETGEKRSNKTPDNSPRRRKDRRRKSPSSSPTRSRSPNRSSTRDKFSTKSRYTNSLSDRKAKIKTEPISPLHENSQKRVQNKGKDSLDTSTLQRRKNSDQSPPRRKQNSSSRGNSPARDRKYSDQSPPRRERISTRFRHSQTPDNSPARHRRNSSHSPPKSKRHVNRPPDSSPPRRKRNFHQSPVKTRRSASSDISPPRRRRSPDQSPPRKSKSSEFRSETGHTKDSNQSATRGRSPDLSPPRQRRNIDQFSQYRPKRDSQQSPSWRRKRSHDVSPPRKSKQKIETPDNSPPRKSRKVPDLSPPRRRNSDQSPPRRKIKPSIEARVKQETRTPDLSPPAVRKSRWENQESEKSQSPPPTHKPKPGKTLEGKKAGLQNAQDLQKEIKERRKKEEFLFETMSSDISGRNAEVQVRSTGRKGRRAREAADEDPEERRRKEEYEEKKKQQYDRWGKGLKQIEDHKNRMMEQEYESSKPLARYANDEDLERHLREQERAEDPMLEYMRQKRKAKEKQSGKPEVPRYKGSYPENRFGIRPGYRWDGVDRSNGYEKKYFAVQNEKQARQDEAYKYSVEDM